MMQTCFSTKLQICATTVPHVNKFLLSNSNPKTIRVRMLNPSTCFRSCSITSSNNINHQQPIFKSSNRLFPFCNLFDVNPCKFQLMQTLSRMLASSVLLFAVMTMALFCTQDVACAASYGRMGGGSGGSSKSSSSSSSSSDDYYLYDDGTIGLEYTCYVSNMSRDAFGFLAAKYDHLEKYSRPCFRGFLKTEVGKFDKNDETFVNVHGVKFGKHSVGKVNNIDNEYSVVTLLVLVDGEYLIPSLKGCAPHVKKVDIKTALQKIHSIPRSDLEAVEVLWTPQTESDIVSEQEVLRDFGLLMRPVDLTE